MFSGQGSHYFHMGKSLFEHDATFRRWMLDMDQFVRNRSGQGVLDTLYDERRGKGESFDRTLLTHPAIFMVEYALAQTLIERGVVPDLTLGVSLGAAAAAAVSGCIGVEDALEAVLMQASALEDHCQPGGMIAILSTPEPHLLAGLREQCEIASFNFPGHFVIAAQRDSLAPIQAALRERHLTFQTLPVSFAFHSRWIDAARPCIERNLAALPRKPALIPMVCCARAGVLTQLPQNYFWNVAREPIRFQQTIAELEKSAPYRYLDLGPAGTLATFLKYTLPPGSASTAHAVLSPFGGELLKLSSIGAYALTPEGA
ncbi:MULTISPECIES: acyltransferase domain-containing protein [unclassified Janthinobacterium]|uniref:acyltransferase domain-containing protein n=1 Tax=unclassified Janthinobacterium TaxID=2610881 RepID=UPI0003453949|nr:MULTISPECIES: acyltransferase domain-containing protein [unclassified Janthinobacterium]